MPEHFGGILIGAKKAGAAWGGGAEHTRAKQIWESVAAYDTPDAFAQLGFGSSAADTIRSFIKTYMFEYSKALSTKLIPIPTLEKLQVPSSFIELENVISESKAILSLEVDADAGITEAYIQATWDRATTLLRALAALYWQATGDSLSPPSIAPAASGSIDLFWDWPNLTLLINVPSDASKGITFFGRRFNNSKISGVVGADDIEPRHLAGWLAFE
jgi:hypothetical protein